MTKTAWSMMEMGGGPSVVFLSNSSLIFLIQVSNFSPLLSFCFWLGLGRGGGGGEGVVGSQDRSFIRVIMLLILIISLNFKC